MLSEENKFPEHCLKLEEVAGSATYKQSCQQSFFLVLFVCFVLFCLLAENNQPVKILVFWLEFPLPNDNVPLRGFNTSTTSKVTKTKNFWTTWLTLTVVFFRWSLWTCFQLHQRRYVFTCVSWLVCQHDSTKTTEWISDKLGWTMGLGPEQIPIKGLWLILRDWTFCPHLCWFLMMMMMMMMMMSQCPLSVLLSLCLHVSALCELCLLEVRYKKVSSDRKQVACVVWTVRCSQRRPAVFCCSLSSRCCHADLPLVVLKLISMNFR